ncbi:MAG: discoidin domain-containing protein [Paludibacter sp.]|nr:discoidin domain-containing protein [Paludibacter sp.]
MKHFTNFRNLLFALALSLVSVITYGQKYSGLTATASSGDASAAVDNNMGTRWESGFEDPQWIVVDLGEVKNVNAIKIYWEAANAKDYTLSFSADGEIYGNELSYTDKSEGTRTDVIENLDVDCRYIKMNGTARNLTYGYSIWEFEVYPAVTPVLTRIAVTPATANIQLGESQQFSVAGYDQLGNDYTLTNETQWTVDETGANIDENGFFTSTQKGLFTVTATNSELSATATVEVLPTNDNLSITGTATASSGTADAAIDNAAGTRWESEQGVDPQWIMIDLGERKHITDILISWEAANAKDYMIETSIDGNSWTTLEDKTDMPEGARVDRYYDLDVNARFVKLTGTSRNLTYGYSIWEFKIFGTVALSTSQVDTNYPEFRIFPNPASKILTVSDNVVKTDFYSLQGQFIRSVSNQKNIEITSFSQGLYLVRLTDNKGNQKTSKLEIK